MNPRIGNEAQKCSATRVLVTEGLSDGDTVVTGGHQKLYSGAKVTVK